MPMLLGPFTCLRLLEHPTESESLPVLSASDIPSFLQSHNRSVILYVSSPIPICFMDYAIARYRDRIAFALANATSGPRFAAYSGDAPLPLLQPGHSAAAFATWCENVLEPGTFRLLLPEQFRDFLNGIENAVFCVDCDRHPEAVASSVPFFSVNQAALSFFKLPADRGALYLWRPRDRQLLPFLGDFDAESQTPILSARDAQVESKEFFCGYYIAPNEDTAVIDIEILLNLSAAFGDRLQVVATNLEDGNQLAVAGRLLRQPLPFFFMFRSGAIGPNRWWITDDEAHSWATVSSFVERVLNGSQPYTFLNSTFREHGPEVRWREVNSIVADKFLLNHNKVTLLMLITGWCALCRNFYIIGNYTSYLVDPDVVEFYWMHGETNDIPPVVPDFVGFPQLFLWPAGENYTKPVRFNGDRTVPNLFKFIEDNGGHPNFTPPEYDLSELNTRIAFYTPRGRHGVP
jgi:hypothetical protein